MNPMNVFIVEDKAEILKQMVVLAETAGFTVKTATSVPSANQIIQQKSFFPHVVVLDRILHDADSVSLIPDIKASFADTKILIVSAIDTPTEKALALDTGADDYMAKPFSSVELIARIKALARRKNLSDERTVTSGNLVINKEDRIVKIDQKDVGLSQKEFLVLNQLISSPGKVFPKDLLLQRIWNTEEKIDTRVVEATINNLRRKLEKLSATVRIRNVRNVGYWLET